MKLTHYTIHRYHLEDFLHNLTDYTYTNQIGDKKTEISLMLIELYQGIKPYRMCNGLYYAITNAKIRCNKHVSFSKYDLFSFEELNKLQIDEKYDIDL